MAPLCQQPSDQLPTHNKYYVNHSNTKHVGLLHSKVASTKQRANVDQNIEQQSKTAETPEPKIILEILMNTASIFHFTE